MKITTTRARRSAAAAVASSALLFGLAACGAANEDTAAASGDSDLTGTLNGAGASSIQSATDAWKQGFQTANSAVTVNYDSVGSGGGREQFIAGGVSFAGSDAYLSDEELPAAQERCEGGDVLELPMYVSPVAVIYHLEGVDDLKLSASTIGAIFAGDVTTWNDPAIAEDNPDADLPNSTITPVHRGDSSGTTKNFTAYLEAASDGSWSHGAVEDWPVEGGEAAQQTSGVVQAVTGGNGTIGYADASQAGDLDTVAVKVGDDYVQPSPEAASKVLDSATQVEGRAATDLALDIDRQTTEAGVYPIVLVSYLIACQEYADADEAALVKAWLTHVGSEQGQQDSADAAGSAPLSADFRAKVEEAIATIAS